MDKNVLEYCDDTVKTVNCLLCILWSSGSMICGDDVAGNRLFRNIGSSVQATLEFRITQKIT